MYEGEETPIDFSIAFKTIQICRTVQPSHQSVTPSCLSSRAETIQYGQYS